MQICPLDESGNAVDWWFIYKVPKLAKSGATASATGYEYVYYDTTVGKVAQSPHLLTDGKGALDLTLDSVFKKPAATTGWILYNDEMPADVKQPNDNNLGHSKGVIAFDTATDTAFWLLHSWPKYAGPGATLLPTPMYGQTYLCMSIDLATARQLATEMLTFQEPQSYLPRLPASLAKTDPLYALTQPIDLKAAGTKTVIDVKTRGGLPFKVIAKSRLWNEDFWSDLVGPTLKADMDDETWIRGKIPPVLDSDGVHKTVDLKYIDSPPGCAVGMAGDARSCQMGHHERRRLGLRRRHQPYDHAGEARRRRDRPSGQDAVVGVVENRIHSAAARHDGGAGEGHDPRHPRRSARGGDGRT